MCDKFVRRGLVICIIEVGGCEVIGAYYLKLIKRISNLVVGNVLML